MPAPEPPPVTAFEVHGRSDVGLEPTENQDRFIIATVRKSVTINSSNLEDEGLGDRRLNAPDATLLAVADGVGGRAGGAVASSTAVRTLLEYVVRAGGCYQRFDVAEEDAFIGQMEAGIRDAHESILRDYGNPHYAPATTLTMMMLIAPRAYIVHVGDTRAYCLRRGRLLQLTRDQTMGQYMLDVGAWTEEQVRRAPNASVLASAIGSSEVTPVVGLIDLEPGDVILVCSDGLTKHVDDATITDVLTQAKTAHEGCDALVERALSGGGSDNVTVVVGRVL